MSKAFAGESDGEEADIPPVPLPPGTRNYMTPEGEKKLKAEREKLLAEKANVGPAGFEADRRRKFIDRRLEFLNERLNAAQVVDPAQQPSDRVLFGASVTVRDGEGAENTWRIVGLDETDLDKGWISWMSPLATQLLDQKSGATVLFAGRPLTVVKIEYV